MDSYLKLENKTAFVTGAGQGMGRDISETYAQAGAKVFAADINEKTFPSEKQENLEFIKLDVMNEASIKDTINKIKPDIVVNVAGIVHHGSILDCTKEDWDLAMNLNVRSAFVICQTAIPHMVEKNFGCIINMSSVASSLLGVPVRFAYSVSKAALLGLTKSIAADYIKNGIRANAICPGTVRTPSWEQRVEDLAKIENISVDEARAKFEARQPMGRVGEVGEISQLALYLASDAGAFTTGQEFSIDGGWSKVK